MPPKKKVARRKIVRCKVCGRTGHDSKDCSLLPKQQEELRNGLTIRYNIALDEAGRCVREYSRVFECDIAEAKEYMKSTRKPWLHGSARRMV